MVKIFATYRSQSGWQRGHFTHMKKFDNDENGRTIFEEMKRVPEQYKHNGCDLISMKLIRQEELDTHVFPKEK